MDERVKTTKVKETNASSLLWAAMLRPFLEDSQDEMNPSQKERIKFVTYFFIYDFLIFNFSILSASYIKQLWSSPPQTFFSFLLLGNSTFLIVNFFVKKYTPGLYINRKYGLWFLARTTLGILYLSAFVMVLFRIYYFSRIHFFLSFFLYQAIISFSYLIFYQLGGNEILVRLNGYKDRWHRHGHFNIKFILFDFFLFTLSYYGIYYLRYHSLSLAPEHERMFILLLGTGALAGLSTRKFEVLPYRNFFYKITPAIKSFLVMFALTGLSMFFLGWYNLSHKLVFGSITSLFTMEIFGMGILYILRNSQQPKDIERIEDVEKEWKKERVQLDLPVYEETLKINNPVRSRLKNRFLVDYPELFSLIDNTIDLNSIDENYTSVLNTHNSYNVEIIDDNSRQILLNLHKINDFRRLNRYFLIVHRKLRAGGYLIGQAHTLNTHKTWMYERFPFLIANIIYPVDFVFRRVFPKLPGIKKIYFFITKGKNRLISRAEVLGRLCFCGFKVIAEKEINNRLYFIAQKVRFPSVDRNPSYGPLIKLRRIGLDGKQICIYKFRTMHPYSEYLQDYIYERYHLQANGKFANDFRITTWGRWMRKLWIDELPQLYNFLRGDLAIFGVRALSPHYFSLYPPDLQKLRVKFKPGLVPPYYADLPNSFEEIIESERRYLMKKMKSPFITDCIYFTKAMFNIFFRNARSR